MPIHLEGSCRCGTVRFDFNSHTPVPYQLCYCSICRKTARGSGAAINIMGLWDSLKVEGREAIAVYQATIEGEDGHPKISEGRRHFCSRCASALWLHDERWPSLFHPFASVIDTPLPRASERVHLCLADKPAWVNADVGPDDRCFDGYPEQSIEDWHKSRGLWVA